MMGSTRLKTAALTINHRTEGEGAPLLFLGGSNFDLSIRAPVFESVLSSHYSITAADYRGLGKTDAPPGEWTMQDYAMDALNLLDALALDKVHVLGESFGAMTAMHLAALAPDRLLRMALVAGSPGGAGGSSYPIHEFLTLSDPYQRARNALEVLDTRFSSKMATSPAEAHRQIHGRVLSEAQFFANRDNASGYERLLRARASHNAWDLLPGIHVPTLVFYGLHDGQAPPDRSQNIAAALPDARLFAVDGSHSLCFSTTEVVNTIIQHWTS